MSNEEQALRVFQETIEQLEKFESATNNVASHGVPPEIEGELKRRNFLIRRRFDAATRVLLTNAADWADDLTPEEAETLVSAAWDDAVPGWRDEKPWPRFRLMRRGSVYDFHISQAGSLLDSRVQATRKALGKHVGDYLPEDQ